MIKPHKNRALGTVIGVQYFPQLDSHMIGSMISWRVKNSNFWLKKDICTARLSYWQYQLHIPLTGKSWGSKSPTWIQNYCCCHWNYRRITTFECCNHICSGCWAEYHSSVITKFKAGKCKVSQTRKFKLSSTPRLELVIHSDEMCVIKILEFGNTVWIVLNKHLNLKLTMWGYDIDVD